MSEINSGNLKQKGLTEDAPLIIGIGASAGGLEALQQFFSCMPQRVQLRCCSAPFTRLQKPYGGYFGKIYRYAGDTGFKRYRGYAEYGLSYTA